MNKRSSKQNYMNAPLKLKTVKMFDLLTKSPLKMVFVIALTSCSSSTNQTKEMELQKNTRRGETISKDTTPRVTGIGGIFFFSDDVEATKKWYSTHLGIETDTYGSSFEFRNANRPEEINYLQWSPFKKGSTYFSPSKKEFMINYRVQNIRGLVKKLRENGVTVLDEIETFDYGKFIHIMDAEGNKIELWEPIDSVFTALGGKTTK
jgi:predicted enzyme related to lactoylglutathione lyase